MIYDKDFDKSKFNDKQLDIINRYSKLIESTKDIVNVKTVNFDEKIQENNDKSLRDINAAGITIPYSSKINGKEVGTLQNIYLARNPHHTEGKDIFGQPIFRPEPSYYRGLVSMHEIGGHAYLRVTVPMLSKKDQNKLVEDFENMVRTIYKIDGIATMKGYATKH